MTAFLLLPTDFTPEDIADLNALLEAKLNARLAAKYLYARVMQDSGAGQLQPGHMVDAGSTTGPANPALSPRISPLCADCAWLAQDGDGPCATHARHCEGCGRAEGLHDGEVSKWKLGPGESPIVERWCSHCDPPITAPDADGIFRGDSWDLDSEELYATAPLPRETPQYFGRDRADYDPCDDKADLNPHSKTEKP